MIRYLSRASICVIAGLLCLALMTSGAPAADNPGNAGLEAALVSGPRTDAIGAVDGGSDWTVYLRPGIRFGKERTIGYWDILVPLYRTDKSVLFFNPRINFDDRSGQELNVGLGYRHLLAGDRLILGVNTFFDWRKSHSGHWYRQAGIGGEVLTEWVNARVNGYISLSDSNRVDPYQEWYFAPTSLEYSWAYSLEEPMSGLDYEVGVKVPFVSDYVETWVYGLGYTYFSDYMDDVQGWGARLELIPTDFVKLNYEYRYDNSSHGEHYGEVAFEIPFSVEKLAAGGNPFEGVGDMFTGSRPMKERLNEQVHRDVDVIMQTSKINYVSYPSLVIPGDPTTYYYDVYYVAPGHSGTGTLSNPGSMAQAEASGAPTVFLLAGSYGGYNWDNSNTKLFGMTFQPALINSKMPFYPWMMPGLSVFTDTLGINASNVAVEGLIFSNSSVRSIIGNGGGFITLTRNSFATYLDLRGFDTVTFTNNSLTDNGSGGGDGLYVRDPASGHLNALVSGNTFYVTGPSPRSVHLRSFTGAGTLSATITNNTIYAIGTGAPANSCNGIWIDAGGVISANVSGNSIISSSSNSNATGMRINSDGGDVYAMILNNRIDVSSSVEDATAVELRATGLNRIFGSLSGNSGSVSSADDAVMFIFRTGNPGAGSSVNWSGSNSYTTSTGWQGNYDTGSGLPGTLSNGRIWTNFQPGDTLVP